MKITESLRRSLQIIANAPGLRPDAFAHLYFDKDHPGWRRHTRCGHGTRRGGGLVLWAGGQLGKLKAAGLVNIHHELTKLGREALATKPTGKAPARNICERDPGGPHDDRCSRQPIESEPVTRGSVERAQWLADKLRNGGDYREEVATLLVHQAMELDYLRAVREGGIPTWVPLRVRLPARVLGDYPIGHAMIANQGEHECQSNRFGAVGVIAENGKLLGVKPGEFEVVAWRENHA